MRRILLSSLAFFAFFGASLYSQDLRITLPKRSQLTPVQKLNREGVKRLEKHDYNEAKKLFYKAYLLDPDDPFTLNNLGYMAELDGSVDRAQRFYDLAQQQESSALVDVSTVKDTKGKTVAQVAGHADQNHMAVNSLNVQALSLLTKDRASEADLILSRSLKLDPQNPFTLNNLGYAKEKQGEYSDAEKYYQQAAALNSKLAIVVTPNKDWRGKAISDVARRNAENVSKLARRAEEDVAFRVATLNLRGVSAINRNEAEQAGADFEQAYKLAPNDAFTLNNMGYFAEMQGDRETAQFYYEKARHADDAGARVQIATRKEDQGRKLTSIAANNDADIDSAIAAEVAERRAMGPPKLRTRAPKQQPASNEQPSLAPQ